MASRYYDSCSNGEEIKPGRISAELREALNIAENDIPLWIYRMRALGYPPGWLKKAVVDTNDIFDTDNSEVDKNTSTSSSGSRKRKQPSSEEIQYDHSKLIEYPGFNSPMPKNCVDYHYFINMPAMLEHQQLEYAKKHMNAFKPVQIPKRARFSGANNDSSNSISESIKTNSTERLNSEENDSDEIETKNSEHNLNITKNLDINKSTTSLPDEIKLVSKGSPMPKPVQRAPLEKFSEGVVGELLYFENLPTSTGKFDSIRGLLNTIRRSKSENDTSFTGSTKSEGNNK